MKKEEQKKEIIKEKCNNNQENQYHRYLWYLVLFSIIGLLLETIYCLIISKAFNKSFSLLLGPLCIIYGLTAIISIALLDKFRGHKFKLFVLGSILCTMIEYVISFIIEATFGVRLWNCLWTKFNINGRVCIEHAILWGISVIITVDVLKKYIDLLISKIQGKRIIIIDIIVTIMLSIIMIFTIWGTTTYTVRARETLNGKNYTSNNNIIEKIQNTIFSNKIMEKVFSEMGIIDNQVNWILIKNING